MRSAPSDRSGASSDRAWMDVGVVHAAARGDRTSARRVLEAYARRRQWSPETIRGRLDGVGALLAWFWAVDSSPIDRLSRAEVAEFRNHLARRGLASSTIKAYVKGARSLYDALHSARGDLPALDHPFRSLPHVEQVHVTTRGVVTSVGSSSDVRVALLHALIEHGLSVAEAARLAWRDVSADGQVLTLVRRGMSVEVPLSDDAQALMRDAPRRDERVLGWGPEHARRMLRGRVGGA